MGFKPVNCERCKRPIRKGKRWCKTCAVQVAKEFGFDEYFTPEPKPEDEDPVAAYEKANHLKTIAALALITIVGVLALWVAVGGM